MDQGSAVRELPDNVFEVSPMKKDSDEKVVISITDSDVKEVETLQETEADPLKKEIIICEDITERTNKILPFEPLSVERNKRRDLSDDLCECLSGKHESRQECLTDRRLNDLNSHDAKLNSKNRSHQKTGLLNIEDIM